nr:pupal cuticle protein-like [Megalopta genalis]
MRSLLLFSCLVLSATALPGYAPYAAYAAGYHGPAAPLAHDGRVVDTPEVAHAKAAHLAAHAAEAAKSSPLTLGYADYDGRYEDYSGAYAGPALAAYHGPPAPLAHDGRVIDTPEVAHAKAAHLAAHAEQISKIASLSYAEPYPQPHCEYGRLLQVFAPPPGDASDASDTSGGWQRGGDSLELPSVEKQRSSDDFVYGDRWSLYLCNVASRVQFVDRGSWVLAALGLGDVFVTSLDRRTLRFDKMLHYLVIISITFNAAFCAPQWYGGGHPGAYGGHAAPAPLGPDGRVVDTPEVAQLKAAHLAALADANARAPKVGPGSYAGPSGPYAPSNYAHYSGPPAPLGPDGRVVDTAEVQQAKAVHFSLYNAEAQRGPGPAGPAAPAPSWNPSGAYNPPNQWNQPNSWNHY